VKKPVFVGSAVAIVTPYRKERIDFDKMAELIEHQIAHKTAAIVVNGTTGETSTQSIPEHLANIEHVVHCVAGRVPVIAGTGSNDTKDAVTMSVHAERFGADALLLVTPYYNKTSQKGLVAHFTEIADKVNIPVILYNVPSRTGLGFTADTYARLSTHPNIVGVKEASGDFTLIAKTRSVCPEDFCVWSGNDDQTVPIMSLGGKGVISVAANIIPRVMADMTEHYLAGRVREAADLQIRYFELCNALFMDVNPIPVKTAMNILGYDVGVLRMPLIDMEPPQTEKLKAALRGAGLLPAQDSPC
jgi:4-hydroxy-tetrahydrodipicolinate synthase